MLPAVLVTTLIAGVLGMSLVELGRRGAVTGTWSRDHLALRLLAESAVEEMYADLQKRANVPGEPVFGRVRTLPPGTPATPIRIEGVGLPNLQAELEQQKKVLNGTVSVTSLVTIRRVEALSGDPLEKSGLIVLEAGAQLVRGRRVAATERVRSERAFTVSRVTPPRPLDQVGLFIARTSAQDLRPFRGQMAYALAAGQPRRLIELMTSSSRDGFMAVPGPSRREIARALASLTPAVLSRRSQMVVRSVSELRQLWSGRLTGTQVVSGVISLAFTECVSLRLTRFRGKCLLAASGPIEVQDITLDDPRRDSLTIVSPARIVVSGRQVEANLVSTSDGPDGLVFRQRASVKGSVIVGRFPRSFGISARELGDCEFMAKPDLGSGSAPDSRPDDCLMSRYVVALSPYALAVQHARDQERWVAW